MVEITFKIDGETVEPDNMKDVLDIMFLEHLRDELVNTLKAERCKEHGHEPKITVKGESLDDLSIEVNGCCEDFIERTRAKIK